MAVSGKRIIKMTATLDLYSSGLSRLNIKGVRLVAGSGADATAVLRENDANGDVVYSLAAVQKTADDSAICAQAETGKLHLTLTGAGAEVFVYLE